MFDREDGEFGPANPNRFDFTILFEHAMLGLVPAGIFVLATPFFFRFVRSDRQVQPGVVLWLKIAASIALMAIQLASLVLWRNTAHTAVALAASALAFLASICVITIVYITHVYTIQSSALLSVFLTLTMLFDVTMARSYFMRDSLGAIASLQVAVASIKLALVVLEEISKRNLLNSRNIRDNTGAEQVSGFWNRSMLIWVTRLVVQGARRTLRIEDLPPIGQKYSSEQLFDRFTPYWENTMKTNSNRPLVRAMVRTLYLEFLSPVIPRLCLVGFSFGRPFLIQRVIDVVSISSVTHSQTNGLIGATILIFGGLAVSGVGALNGHEFMG